MPRRTCIGAFRNPASGGGAIASAIRNGYQKLAQVNEYFYELGDKELQALIVQVTGSESDSSVAKLTLSTLKALKAFANFEAGPATGDEALSSAAPEDASPTFGSGGVGEPSREPGRGLTLSYTINLNLLLRPTRQSLTRFSAASGSIYFPMRNDQILEKIKAFGMTNQMLAEDLGRIASVYAVDLGLSGTSGADVEEIYYPQFEAAVRRRAATMGKHSRGLLLPREVDPGSCL